MKLNDVMRHATRWYKDGISVHLFSAPGRGKSTIMEALPEIVGKRLGLNLGIVVVNGTLLTPMHMIGFGVPKHSDNHSQMIFTDPFFWTTSEGKRLDEYDGGWVFVDEADKCDVDVKKILGEGAYSNKFGPHILPNGWRVWTAGNRASDRSGSTKELDHLINRRKHIPISDDVVSLVDFSNKSGALPVITSFIEAYPQVVFTEGVPDKQGPWCTPRSLMFVDRMLKGVIDEYSEIPDEFFVQEEINGLIGDAATSQFMTHLRLEMKLPKFEDIIAKPDSTPVPDAADARMLVCYNVAHRACKDTIDAVVTYMRRLPDPFAVTFTKAVAQRAPMLMVSKPMQKWTSDNNGLMTLMHSLQTVNQK